MLKYKYPAIHNEICNVKSHENIKLFFEQSYFKKFYILEWKGNNIEYIEVGIDEVKRFIYNEKELNILSEFKDKEYNLVYIYDEEEEEASFTINFLGEADFLGTDDEVVSDYMKLVKSSYEIIQPLFVRTVYEGHEGLPAPEETEGKKIVMFHWIQILSPEMMDENNKKKIKKLIKLYKIEELPDGALYVQLTKYPDFIDELRYIDKKLKLECPEELKYW